jgi:hypothetical protein
MDRFGTEPTARERLSGGWPVIPAERLPDLSDAVMARWPGGGPVSKRPSMAGLGALARRRPGVQTAQHGRADRR